MIELDRKDLDAIVYEATPKVEDLATVLRSIYTRYMTLYEIYFRSIDELCDVVIENLKEMHEVSKSLRKYYYLDIPMDIHYGLAKFDKDYTDKLLGPDWHDFLFKNYEDYKDSHMSEDKTEEEIKAEFEERALSYFYDDMDYIFRDDFGTGSKTEESLLEGLKNLFTIN